MLREVLKVIGYELKSLTEERVEGLSRCPFTNCECCDEMDGDVGVPFHRVHLLGGQVKQIVILHRLGALLEQGGRIVEIDRDGHF